MLEAAEDAAELENGIEVARGVVSIAEDEATLETAAVVATDELAADDSTEETIADDWTLEEATDPP